MSNTIVILGACGGARQAYVRVRDKYPGMQVVFVDDKSDITEIRMANSVIPVVKDWNFSKVRAGNDEDFRSFICGAGNPKVKKTMVERAIDAGLTAAPTFVDNTAVVTADSVGVGGAIMPGCVVSPQVRIGDYVHLDGVVVVGHDSIIEDYATCAPGVVIPGNVHIGRGSFLGVGTVLREGVAVAPGTVTGAQTCVVKDVLEENKIIIGVPGKVFK